MLRRAQKLQESLIRQGMGKIALSGIWFVASPLFIFLIPTTWRLQAVDYGIPIATTLVIRALFQQYRTASAVRWNIWFSLLVGTGCFLIGFAVVPIGYKLGWSCFTYGVLQDSSALFKKIFLQEIPLIFGVTWLGYEWTLRGIALSRLRAKWGLWPALMMSALAGLSLQWARLPNSNGTGDCVYLCATAGELLIVEIICGLLFVASGRLAPSAIFHGLMRITEMFLLGDILSPYLPLRNLISSNPRFYAARVGVLILLVVLLTMVIHASRRRELKNTV